MAVSSGDPAVAPATADPATAVRLDPRSLLVGVLGVIVLVGAAALIGATRRSITILVVGTLFACAVEPLVNAVARRIHSGRAAATVVVFAGIFAMFATLALLVGPAAIRQAERFGEQLPDTLAQLEELPLIGDRLAEWDLVGKVQQWIDDLPSRVDPERIADTVRGAAAGVLNGLAVLLVALVVTLDGPLLVRRLRTLVPQEGRDEADAVGQVLARVIGTYFAGSFLVASIAGTWVLIVCLVLGVPLAPIAAVWYAVASLIPQVGGFLGTAFVALLAFSEGVPTGLAAVVLVVGYMNFENYVLGPAIVGDAVNLTPPITMLAAIIGGAAAGVPGALGAVPLCGSVKALYLHFRHGEALPVKPKPFRERLPGPLRKLFPGGGHPTNP